MVDVDNSLDFYRRLLDEKYSTIKKRFVDSINAFGVSKHDQIVSANNMLFEATENLIAVLSGQDQPEWLKTLHTACAAFQKEAGNINVRMNHLHHLIQLKSQIENHRWAYQKSSDNPLIDFDAILEECQKKNNISELFDSLIEQITKILAFDEIDSQKAQRDLEQVLSTLIKSRDGSLFAQIASWRFVKVYMTNLGKIYLKKIPVIGGSIEAFEKTAEELDLAIDQAQIQFWDRIDEIQTEKFETIKRVISSQPNVMLEDFRPETVKKNIIRNEEVTSSD